jgi:hypothetical protein
VQKAEKSSDMFFVTRITYYIGEQTAGQVSFYFLEVHLFRDVF